MESLQLKFYPNGQLELSMSTTAQLRLNIQLCSATLTELYLEGLNQNRCFNGLQVCESLNLRVRAEAQP